MTGFVTYPGLGERAARLEARSTRYRFDLERDVAWGELGRPGLHFGPTWLQALGVDAALGRDQRFQWALGLTTCRAFDALEELILSFAAEEAARLGGTRSLKLLCEEEEKHLALFRRYAAHLRAARPEEAARLEALAAVDEARLGDLGETEPAARHYLFWLNTLFFEELTVWLHEALVSDGESIQPAWRSLHLAHRQEEVQHVLTDAAYLEALALEPAARAALSKRFLFRLEQGFEGFFGLSAATQWACEASGVPRPARAGLRELPLWDLLLRAPWFKRTREAAPYLQELARAAAPGSVAGQSASVPAARPLAWARGPALLDELPPSLGAALERVAGRHPDHGVTWLGDEGSRQLEPYPALLLRARRLLGGLRREGAQPGERLLLLLPGPREHLGVLWAAFLGGLLPAPAAPPQAGEAPERLLGIHARLTRAGRGPLVVAERGLRARLPAGWRVVAPEELLAAEPAEPALVAPGDPALVQFSSGSTGAPRGVLLSHANVLADLSGAIERQGVAAGDVFVSWLPLHHDMGLGYHLTPLLAGARQALLSPLQFAKSPLRWLRALSDERATITAVPAFALAMSLRRLQPQDLAGLDLSPVRCVLVGAEPISFTQLERFARALAPARFRREALCPAYGLAEATVAVSFGEPLSGPRALSLARDELDDPAGAREVALGAPGAAAFVDLGPPLAGLELRVVDSAGATLREGVVGQVEVRGAPVSAGYLDDAEATAISRRPEGWVRTGDLGLLRAGRLVLTGRAKDVVFVHGQCLHASDLERVACEVEGVASERVAVFGSTDPAGGGERLVVAVHVLPGRERAAVAGAVAARVGEAARYPVHAVVCLPAGAFPRTTSGKLQREALRGRFERGELEGAVGWRGREEEEEERARARAGDGRGGVELGEVLGVWARVLGTRPEAIDPDLTFFAQGGDSLRAVEVHTLLEERCGRLLDQRVLLEGRTPRTMAAALRRELGQPAEPAASSAAGEEPIAVVAVACRFPGAGSPEALWELLRAGRVATRPVPPSRWSLEEHHDPQGGPGKSVCGAGGFLDDALLRGFDPEPFGLPAGEARQIDPQQRLFLELSSELLDAVGPRLRRVGVFAGVGGNQYFQRLARDPRRIGRETAQASLPFMTAARVAALLGLSGPALTVDAACATSLVTAHLACQALRAGECQLAIAGGVELNLGLVTWLLFSQAGVLSPRGRCQPFASQADGFVPGEGGGALLLAPLSFARREGLPVLALIRGSAVNNDGGGLSGLAPNPAGQRAVIQAAWERAGLDPRGAGYVEAHGTGTPVGDAVEASALAQLLQGAPRGSVALGSIKANLGHLLNAAGAASLIKVVLALGQRELPPTPGCETPHPGLRLPETALRVLSAACPWEGPGPRRAGVSGFGIGGTNCHVVLEEAPPPPPAPAARDAELLCLSAPSPQAMARVAAAASQVLRREGVGLGALAAGLSARAGRFPLRCALVARDAEEAVRELGRLEPPARAVEPPRVVWLFPGPGAHFPGMGAHLRHEPAFRDALARVAALLRDRLGAPLEELLFEDGRAGASAPAVGDTAGPRMDRIALTQPVLFAFELALAAWLGELGLEPAAVIGHSAGEYAAAVAAGALSLETALELVLARGQAMSEAPPGRMSAVLAPAARVRPLLAGEPGVALAAENGPEQVVLSGEAAGVERVLAALRAQGVEVRPLNIDCAAHSPLMESAQARFAPALVGLSAGRPRLPLFSTRTGARAEALDAAHWRAHLRDPVRFLEAVQAARAAGFAWFLEVGPGATLSGPVSAALGAGVEVHPLLRRTVPGWAPTLEALGRLFQAGAPLDVSRLAGARRARPIAGLPAYPWARRELWIEAPPAAEVADARELEVDLRRRAAIADHRVFGRPVAPAALLLDLALAELRGGPCALEDVLIGRPLAAGEEARADDEAAALRTVRVRRARREETPRVVVESRPASASAAFEEHLSAALVAAPAPRASEDLASIRARCSEEVDPARLYARLETGGLAYGPSLRAVTGLRRGPGEVLARLEPAGGEHPFQRLEPALVDGAMQSVAGLTLGLPALQGATFLGFAIRRVEVHAPVAAAAWAHVRLSSALDAAAQVIRCDVQVLDDEGRVLARFDDVGVKRFAGWAQPRFYAPVLAPEPLPAARRALPVRAGTLLIGAEGPLRAALQRRVEAAGAVAPVLAPPQDPAGWEAAVRRHLAGQPAPPALVLLGLGLAELGELTRALLAAGVSALADALLVAPEAAPFGFWRVAGREQPGWRCRGLWVEPDELQRPTLAGTILDELLRAPERFLVTHREDERQALVLEELRPRAGEPALRARGVYWITGGLGGIGLVLAEALAARAGARLLLTGRRPTPDPAALQRLSAAGGEPLYVQADAADLAAMRRARDLARARWGRIDGIVHAAGVLDDRPLGARTPERTRAVLAPKIDGARHLVALTAEDELDFLVFFSSVAALHGVPGQADYAAGNAFLDGLARRLERGRTRVMALDWGPWREVGMVLDAAYQRGFAAQGLRPFSPHAGVRAFFQALDLSARQVAVLDLEPGAEAELLARFNRLPGEAPAARPAATAAAAPLRAFLIEALARSLRCAPEQVDPSLPFARLGVDSLMAVSLVHALERKLGLALYPTLLFEHPTVEALVAHLERQGALPLGAAAPAAPVTTPAALRQGAVRGWLAGAGGLEPAALEVGPPGPGEVRIAVRAAGVNFIDLLAAAGHHPVIREPSFVPGHEAAGVVLAAGEGVSAFAPGDRVMALLPRGGYAQEVIASAEACLPLPSGLSFAGGASLVVTGLTAIACLEEKGRLRAGERVLIQAAAGATGLACVQLALHLGATVLGTASAPEKLARLRDLGVAWPLDYRREPFDDAVRRVTAALPGGPGVDLVVDSLSGDAIPRGLALLRPGGRFVEIGAAGVVAPPAVDPGRLFMADQDLVTVNVARLDANPGRRRALFDRLEQLVAEGVLRPQVGHALPLEDAPAAHALLRERRNLGKVVLVNEESPGEVP